MSRYELTEQSRQSLVGEYLPAAPQQQPIINVHVHNHTVQAEESGGFFGFVWGVAKIGALVGVGYVGVLIYQGQSPTEAIETARIQVSGVGGLAHEKVPEHSEITQTLEGWYIQIKSMITGEEFGSSPIVWAVPSNHGVSSPYGFRRHPILGINKMHNGIDIPAPNGTPVVAAGSGTVEFASMANDGSGNLVKISHGKSTESVYAHLQDFSVSVGDVVFAGEKIGTVGSTGNSAGNHLHFGVKVNGAFVNPVEYRSQF